MMKCIVYGFSSRFKQIWCDMKEAKEYFIAFSTVNEGEKILLQM